MYTTYREVSVAEENRVNKGTQPAVFSARYLLVLPCAFVINIHVSPGDANSRVQAHFACGIRQIAHVPRASIPNRHVRDGSARV